MKKQAVFIFALIFAAAVLLVQGRNILKPAIQAADPVTNGGLILMRNAFINTQTGTEEPVPFSTGVTPEAIINSQPAWTAEVPPARAAQKQYLVHVLDASVDTIFLLNMVMDGEGVMMDYVPHNSYIMYGTEKAAASLTSEYGVDYVGEYYAQYKLSNDIYQNPAVQSDDPDTPIQLIVTLVTDNEFNLAEAAKLAAEWEQSLQTHGIMASVTPTSEYRLSISGTNEMLNPIVAFAAQQPQTHWIEPAAEDEIANKYAPMTSQSGTWDVSPIWAKGLHGEGEIVACADTGIDYDHCHFWDQKQPAPTITINKNHRKLIGQLIYNSYNPYGDKTDPVNGHGTHVAGTLVAEADSTVAAEQAFASQYNGVVYKAKMVFMDVGRGSSVVTPSDLYKNMFPYFYNAGARIDSHSWGSTLVNSYNYRCQDVDKFIHEKKDFLLFQAAGNSGHTSPGTLLAPAGAKDSVTVGCGQNSPQSWKNYCCSSGSPKCCTSDAYDCTTGCGAVTKGSGARPTMLASFSSNGPTDDGRFQPTIIAPGQMIFSTNSDGDLNSFQCGKTFGTTVIAKQGTSMATPVAAGHGTLIRQYFREGWYPTGTKVSGNSIIPSAALIKAMLVNSAVVMTGEGSVIPSNTQGYGRIELDNVLYFSDSTFNLWVDEDQSISKAQTRTSCVNVKAGGTLKVTLVWTDPPGTLSAAIILVNNLDLKVTTPSGTLYYGNHAANGNKADTLNNIEQVVIANAAAGMYTLSVVGTSVPQGPQLYSMVITGRFEYNPSCTVPGTVNPTPVEPTPIPPPVVVEPGMQ